MMTYHLSITVLTDVDLLFSYSTGEGICKLHLLLYKMHVPFA
jgi:hypothetical protein